MLSNTTCKLKQYYLTAYQHLPDIVTFLQSDVKLNEMLWYTKLLKSNIYLATWSNMAKMPQLIQM